MNDNEYFETDEASRQFPWYLLTGLILGLGIGLLVSLVISPVRYSDNAPSMLHDDFKAMYRIVIVQAYQADQDLVRAGQRLTLLDGASQQENLTAQAQLALAAGDESLARAIAELASALNSLSPVETMTPASSPAVTSASSTPQPTNTPLTAVSPSPTRAPTFILVDQQPVCDAAEPAGLLQIEVRDSGGEPVAGVQISIAWESGLDTFYTGLKPAVGAGYADFQMTPGVIYSLRVGSSETLNDLIAPQCTASDGSTFTGGVKLVFGQ